MCKGPDSRSEDKLSPLFSLTGVLTEALNPWNVWLAFTTYDGLASIALFANDRMILQPTSLMWLNIPNCSSSSKN